MTTIQQTAKTTSSHRIYKSIVLKQLAKLQHAQLTVHCDGEQHVFGEPHAELKADLHIIDNECWPILANHGSVGAGQAFAQGLLHTEHLTDAVRIFARNIDVLDANLLDLLGKRMKVADEIGQVKKENNVAVLQNNRWNEIQAKMVAEGAKKGLSGEFITKLFKDIHQESIEHQEKILNS